MARKRYEGEEIVAKLRQVDVPVSQGTTVPDAVRSIGVTDVTYYRWRREYGVLQMDQVKRMKDLELENQRLRGWRRYRLRTLQCPVDPHAAQIQLIIQLITSAANDNCNLIA